MIQEYKFRVEREAEESKRKQIEADGIAAFQKTVSQGISESYLRWRGIEATLALAQSPNAKIVVIGSGKDGLPIILGNVDTPLAPGATPAPGTSGTAPPPAAPGAPAAKPPAASSAPPGAAPPPGAPPQRGSPSGSIEPGPNSTSTASTQPANSPEAQYQPSPLENPVVKSILSRISGAIGLPAQTSTTEAKPGQ